MIVVPGTATMTRRNYLLLQIMQRGPGAFVAINIVDDWARDHPEQDMTEIATYAEWLERA